MIRFECEHCRRPVRVDDAHGGKRGRCPHCQGVVSIPAHGGAIEALAAAVRADTTDSEDTAVGRIPPPPPVGERPLEEDLLLPADEADGLADTVILPSGGFVASPREEPQRLRHRAERRPPALNTRRTLLIVAVAIVVLAAAIIGLVILSRMT